MKQIAIAMKQKRFTTGSKKWFAIALIIAAGIFCAAPLVNGISGNRSTVIGALESLTIPALIRGTNEEHSLSRDGLTLIGGLHDSTAVNVFAVAIDRKGNVYLCYSKETFDLNHNSSKWIEVTRDALDSLAQCFRFVTLRSNQ